MYHTLNSVHYLKRYERKTFLLLSFTVILIEKKIGQKFVFMMYFTQFDIKENDGVINFLRK